MRFGRSRDLVVCRHRRMPSVACAQRSAAWPARDLTLANSSTRKTFLNRPDFRHFQETLAALREFCPTAFPVIVRTSIVPVTVDGMTKRRRNRFVIHLDRNLDEVTATGVLIHEWAHAMSGSLKHDRAADEFNSGKLTWTEFERACHDAGFGASFAEAWATYTTRVLPEST